jgi:hypothetical protein
MGRQKWTNRLTVEECPILLCMNAFYRGGLFDVPPGSPMMVTWPGIEGWSPTTRMECYLAHSGSSGLRIVIPDQLARPGFSFEAQSIRLTRTRPHLGGERYWFLCDCARRAGRIYLPPGQRIFRCRRCYYLTYRSAQTHDQREYDLARDMSQWSATLHSEKVGQRLMAIGALALWMGWQRRRATQ